MDRHATAALSRRLSALAGLILAAGCAAQPARPASPSAPPREQVQSLWELAPSDASAGVVARDGALTDLLDLLADLGAGPVHEELEKLMQLPCINKLPCRGPSGEPLLSSAAWAAAGLDPAQGAAAFSWPDAGRGALLVLPVSDRALFRAAFHIKTRGDGDRELDELEGGYVCATAVQRYLCARSTEILDAAAASHESPLARSALRLAPADRGDIELYADARTRELARPEKQVKDRALGRVAGVAAAIRLRQGGASLRVHVFGELSAGAAKGIAGAPPPPGLTPIAAGAPSVIRVHVDPAALLPSAGPIDAKVKSELVEQLTGDVEITTGGRGLAGLSVLANVVDPARVTAFVRQLCADTGGTMRRYALGQITVRERGCTAVLDPSLLLLPVAIAPVKLSAEVTGGRLVALVGDASEPAPDLRRWDELVLGDDVKQALTSASALVVFSRSLQIGPDVGAGAAFRAMSRLLDERSAALIDVTNDLGAHVYQALLTARAEDGGVVASLDVATFASDPPAARAAYEAALAHQRAGEEAAYHAALAAIEQQFPGSRAQRRAAMVRAGGPYVGAGTLILGALGRALKRSQ